jgi:4-aminobutyrate aminotransferase / (S)-3-amino-2-methylpropionate transaminase / 5-aminovalerate transaminase
LLRAGLYTNCIRFLPEVTIDEATLREALEVVAGAIRQVYKVNQVVAAD